MSASLHLSDAPKLLYSLLLSLVYALVIWAEVTCVSTSFLEVCSNYISKPSVMYQRQGLSLCLLHMHQMYSACSGGLRCDWASRICR